MKEISFSFQVKIPLKRRDVHWIEGEAHIFFPGGKEKRGSPSPISPGLFNVVSPDPPDKF